MTPQGLSAERLAEIEARLAAATPGPFYVYRGEDGEAIAVAKHVAGDSGGTVGKSIAKMPVPITWGDKAARSMRGEINANAALIAHAPTDISDLLSELTRLRALADGMAGALRCFLSDERFQVAVGGNPIVVDRMLDNARAALSAYDSDKAGNALAATPSQEVTDNGAGGEGEKWVDVAPSQVKAIENIAISNCIETLCAMGGRYDAVAMDERDFLETRARAFHASEIVGRCVAELRALSPTLEGKK